MPATQRIYKVDVNEIVNDIALMTVTDKSDTVEIIIEFCKLYSIPLDLEKLQERVMQYREIAEAIRETNPGKPK